MSSTLQNDKNNFDSLRLFFAVLVIFSHAFPLGRGSNATEPLSALTGGQTTLGEVSVWGFFAISGYLITQSWVRSPSPRKYLKRRISRIYPGFAVASLLSAYLIVPLVADPRTYRSISFLSFALDTLRLQVFATPPVFVGNVYADVLNGSLWSIPYEFWCYIGILCIGACGLLKYPLFVILVFTGAVGCHLYMDISGWNPGGGIFGKIFGYPLFWFTVLPFFLAGTIFQVCGGKRLLDKRVAWAAGIGLVASYFIPHAPILALPTCGAYLLMSVAYAPLLNPLNLGRYGDFSYGVYLYAFPIEQILVMRAGGSMPPLELFVLSTLLSLGAAALSWFLVEKHFLAKSSQLRETGHLPRIGL